jgi:hypothetical protein
MSTNYDLLKVELQAKANALTDSILKYKALALIDQYIAAFTLQATSSANDVTSYSIGDRSVTRSSSAGYAATVSNLEAQLNSILGGGCVSLSDHRLYGNANQA